MLWPGIHQWKADKMGRETWGCHPAYPTRPVPAQRLHRALQPHRQARMARPFIIESIEPYGDCGQSPAGQWKAQDHATQWLWTYINDRLNIPLMDCTQYHCRATGQRLHRCCGPAGQLAPPEWLLADHSYDADWFRDALKDKGIKPCIPGRSRSESQSNTTSAATNAATTSRSCSVD